MPIELALGIFCSEPSSEESLSTRRELLSAVRIGYFDGEPASSKLTAQYRNIEQPHLVNFLASSVSSTDAAKYLYVSNQPPFILIFRGLDQYSPIVA